MDLFGISLATIVIAVFFGMVGFMAFRYGKIGPAAAMSLVMFAALLAFTLVYAWLAMRGRQEEA